MRVSISRSVFILFFAVLLFSTVFDYSCLSSAQISVVGRYLRDGHELLVEHHLVLVVFEDLVGVVVVERGLVRVVLEGEMVLWLYCSSPVIINI